ncbi:MAG TPA: hypothetical protein PKV72_05325 [Candidatus Peribacteria bacterium]|nr:hypothetical protein [Candidatus Peribacteria bacterium]
MYYLTLIVVIIGFLMSGCTPAAHDGMEGMDGMHENTASYSAENFSTGSGISFLIRKNNAVMTEFGTSHTKQMHLLVVRDDLTHFSHLHPVMGSGGVWSVAFKPEAAGTYWMYADFTDTDDTHSVQRFAQKYEGNNGAYGLTPDAAETKKVDGLSVHFSPVFNGKDATLAYEVTKNGKPVALEDYLGAKGHAIVLTADGQYLHAHADTDALSFRVTLPAADAFYRTFVEFQSEGNVHGTSFDIIQTGAN